jgi:fimbrial chaperone protein
MKGKNTLQLAVLSKIKLFMRPDDLGMTELEAMNKLSFKQSGNMLTISNPTPYYETIVNLTVGGKKLANCMVSPKEQLIINLPKGTSGEVRFQTVNDYGALTPIKVEKAS